MTEAQNLEALEQRAERALEKAEQGWREFAATMREIKEGEAHREAGYRYFQTYYRERWQEQTGYAFHTVRGQIDGLQIVEEMDAVAEGRLLEGELKIPTYNEANVLRNEFPEAEDRLGAWLHHVESGRGAGLNRAGLNESIDEYGRKAGVIEQLEERGVEIPPYPEGPTDEEVAYKKFSELAAVAKDVTPEAAARAISSSSAYSVAPSYDFMLPWVRGFLAELHLRAGR